MDYRLRTFNQLKPPTLAPRGDRSPPLTPPQILTILTFDISKNCIENDICLKAVAWPDHFYGYSDSWLISVRKLGTRKYTGLITVRISIMWPLDCTVPHPTFGFVVAQMLYFRCLSLTLLLLLFTIHLSPWMPVSLWQLIWLCSKVTAGVE